MYPESSNFLPYAPAINLFQATLTLIWINAVDSYWYPPIYSQEHYQGDPTITYRPSPSYAQNTALNSK